MSTLSRDPVHDRPHPAALELRPVPLASLEAILAGQTPEFPGLMVAECSLPPRHVAARTLRLLQESCPLEWALPFNIVDTSGPTIVGGCGFKGFPDRGSVEVGYGVAASFQRRGAARWALQSLVRRAAASGVVQEVVAHIVPGNIASETVASRVGFRPGELVTDPDGEQVVRWSLRVLT